jgi:hypothetical protein
VHLVDEKNVSGAQVGENGRQVAGAFDHRAGGNPDVDVHLIGDDMGQRRLAQPWRAVKEDMV